MSDDGPAIAAVGQTCPFCGSDRLELVSAWGGQLITSLVRCRCCNTHFEALRDAFAQPAGGEERFSR
jgi:transcription elongation factor Elf1